MDFRQRSAAIGGVTRGLFAGMIIGAAAMLPFAGAQSKGDGPPAAAQKIEVPKDGTLYVWPVPVQGHQSLITLGILDGNTVDAAYLVPVRIRIRGATAPGLSAKGGKEAQQALEKHLAGQLHTAQLWGGDPQSGGMLADFWIAGTKAGEKGHWVSDLMIRGGHAKADK